MCGPGVHLLQLTMATIVYNRGPVAASAEWVDARWNYVTSTKELVTGISNIFMEISSVSDHSGERLVRRNTGPLLLAA